MPRGAARPGGAPRLPLGPCPEGCDSTAELEYDHLVPRAAGGEDAADNVHWACRSCNRSKGSRDFVTWWFACREGFAPLTEGLAGELLRLVHRKRDTKLRIGEREA